MTYLDFLNARVSVRDFDAHDIIEPAKIKDILRYAANAPSSNNFQPWKVFAVATNHKQEKIM
jgi:nitroreductase